MKQKLKFNKPIGERLKAFRKSAGLNLVTFAKKIKIAASSLSEQENGKTAPSAQTLVNLHKKTDANIIWLLTGEGNARRR